MDMFSALAQKIIQEQENIIGPVAIEQARQVPGLIIEESGNKILFNGNQTDIVERLIEKYRELFGTASVEVCKEATKSLVSQLPKEQVPSLLQ